MTFVERAIPMQVLLPIMLILMMGCDSPRRPRRIPSKKISTPIVTIPGTGAMTFSPDGTKFVLCGQVFETRDWSTQRSIASPADHFGCSAVAISPDSSLLAQGERNGRIKLFELASLKKLDEFEAHSAVVTGLGFTADSTTLVSVSMDTTIKRWDVKSRREIGSEGNQAKRAPEGMVVGLGGSIDVVAFSSRQEYMATGDLSNRITIRSVEDGSVLREYGPVAVSAATFSHDAKHLLIASGSGIRVYSVHESTEPILIKAHNNGGINSIAWLGQTEMFALCYINTNTVNGVVEMFDFSTKESMGTFVPHQTSGVELASSPDGRYLATTGRLSGIGDYVVRVWNPTEMLGKLFDGVPPRHVE